MKKLLQLACKIKVKMSNKKSTSHHVQVFVFIHDAVIKEEEHYLFILKCSKRFTITCCSNVEQYHR